MALTNLLSVKKDTKQKTPKKAIPKTAQQTIPYVAAYVNGIFECAPGVFSKTYALSDVDFRTADLDEQEALFASFGQLLNALSDTDIEFTCINRKMDMEDFKRRYLMEMKHDGLNHLRTELNDIVTSHVSNGNSLSCEKYLTVSIKADNIEIASKQFGRIDLMVHDNVDRIKKSEVRALSLSERLELLYRLYNPSEVNIPAFDPESMKAHGTTSKDAIAPTAMKITTDKIEFEDMVGTVLFMDEYPATLSTEYFAELTETPFQMVTSVHLSAMPKDKAMKLIRNQIININANVMQAQKKAAASGYSGDLISPDLLSAREEALGLMEDVSEQDQRLFFTTLVTAVYAKDKEALAQQVKVLQTTAQKHMCTLRKLSYQQEPGFNSVLPLGHCEVETKRLLTTQTASLFMPYSTEEVLHEKGIYYGVNALSNGLVMLNRLKQRNANGVILGTPGSGKSFSAKREILSVLLNTDADIYVVDPEREYASLAQLLGGEVVRIAAGADVYINPFDMDLKYADDEDPVTLKSDFICAICETIAGGKYGLSPIEKSIIDRAVRELYAPYMELIMTNTDPEVIRQNTPTLIDLYELLLSYTDEPEAKNIALSLEMYAVGSLNTFAHTTNVNTHSRFVVYDIKEIGSNMKELGLQVCLNDIWNRTIANRGENKRTWFYLDEFYLLTQTESSARFLQQIFKRARKWGGVPTGITQNVEDLLASQEARSILNNCDFVMMLNQSPIDREELSQMFNIGATLQQYITNVGPGHGLIYTGRSLVPFVDHYPTNTETFRVMTTSPDQARTDQENAVQNLERRVKQ